MSNILSKQKSIVVLVALVFEMCVYAPIEIFLLNRDEFWFGLEDLIGIIALVFAIFFVIFLLPFLFLDTKKRVIYTYISAMIALCMYIQGNFLCLKVGVMNGADIAWKNYLTQMIINLLIWFFALTVGLLLFYKCKKIYNVFLFLSVMILGIQIITLSALVVRYQNIDNNRIKEKSLFTDKGLYVADSGDNTIVFVLDMFDADYFDILLQNEPEWADMLDGFVLFDNCTGTYSTTSYSMSHLYTGKLFYNEMPLTDWVNYVSKERIYADELLDSGYSLYYYSTIPGVIPERIYKKASNYYEGESIVSDHKALAYNMYKLVAYKYFPDCLKPLLWFDGGEFEALRECRDANIYMSDNSRFRDGVYSSKWRKADEKAVRFIYTVGSHYPYRINREGKDVHIGEVAAVDCARGVLTIVNDYLDHLRELETYDNTSIIITADHGYYWDGTLQSPVMLIKPKGSKGRLTISNAPVCQADFASTLLELSGADCFAEYGESMLHADEDRIEERRFYQYYLNEGDENGNYRLIEYKVDSFGRERKNFVLTGIEYMTDGEIIDHYDYCETCKKKYQEENDRDYPRLVHIKSNNYPSKKN